MDDTAARVRNSVHSAHHPAFVLLSRFFDYRIEQPLLQGIAGGGELRVPLHGDEPGVRGQFDRLDGAVRRMANRFEAFCHPTQRLVMPRSGVEFLAPEYFCQTGPGFEADYVRNRFARRRPVQDALSYLIGNMLDESAATRHIQDLCPTANAQCRQSGIHDPAAKFDFQCIAFEIDAVVGFMAPPAITSRVDVTSAGQDQRI